ncbi:hypothetical protein IMCC20628_01748 [Hoeflea sp. IMCC20628]|uniref:DUF1365 domain-containing protein n=1 Tax=Hoeflea sp. IMCC20628 TaxID=1620421 RepID=UPI00063AB7D8|nr:DUF1365 domain-containing protein [Hoeflea sp. IMCC20628]AKI00461.1 hypothetical protein IMCC20628_01748 [Hoeflea sp. IMCC20628]
MTAPLKHPVQIDTNAKAPACLYVGEVMHQRMKPVGHRFAYKVYSLLVDLDRLDEADRLSPLFSVNSANLMSFHEADHLRGTTNTNLRAHIDALLHEAGLDQRAARIELACYPRVFGQVFNPLSVYYAYDGNGEILALVYQVRNTFGESHTYVCKVEPGEVSAAGIRQSRSKLFYVSPFIKMNMEYHFRMNVPAEHLRWRILETDHTGPLLSATYSGARKTLCTVSILACLLQIPLLTWKIVGGIHYEALKLWFKGMRLVPRPAPPPAASFRDQGKFDRQVATPRRPDKWRDGGGCAYED